MALFFSASAIGPLITPWERQARTYERLVTSPASLEAILTGDVLAATGFGAAIALLPLVVGLAMTSVRITAPTELVLGLLLGALAFAALGLLIAARGTDTPSEVMMLSNLVRLPLIFVSGVLVPLDQVPAWGHWPARRVVWAAGARRAEGRLGVGPAPLRGERARPIERRGDLVGHPGSTAIASISTSRSSRTRREISTSVLAGRCAPKYSRRAMLTFSRSATFRRNTVTLHTSANVAPAAARHVLRFSCAWRACATTSSPHDRHGHAGRHRAPCELHGAPETGLRRASWEDKFPDMLKGGVHQGGRTQGGVPLRSPLNHDIQQPVDQQPLRVGQAAGTERPIGPQILMDYRDLGARLSICNNLATGAVWHPVGRRLRLPVSDQMLGQLPALETAQEIMIREHLPQLRGADDDGRRSRHGRA